MVETGGARVLLTAVGGGEGAEGVDGGIMKKKNGGKESLSKSLNFK